MTLAYSDTLFPSQHCHCNRAGLYLQSIAKYDLKGTFELIGVPHLRGIDATQYSSHWGDRSWDWDSQRISNLETVVAGETPKRELRANITACLTERARMRSVGGGGDISDVPLQETGRPPVFGPRLPPRGLLSRARSLTSLTGDSVGRTHGQYVNSRKASLSRPSVQSVAPSDRFVWRLRTNHSSVLFRSSLPPSL